MARKEYIPLDVWADSASDEQLDAAVKIIKKRRNIWLIIWAVCAVFIASSYKGPESLGGLILTAALMLGIIAGFINFINNTLSIVKSRGRKANGGIMIFVYCAMGLFIVPALVTGMCAKDRWGSNWLTGLNKVK